jgi:hypothetical protein
MRSAGSRPDAEPGVFAAVILAAQRHGYPVDAQMQNFGFLLAR